jgi:Retroviral aspartyl protease
MSIVFHAPKPPATVYPAAWAPLEHMHEDDELVYPFNTVRKRPEFRLPELKFLHAVPGRKSLRFELLLRSVFCIGILDSGATHSFITKRFCEQHHLSYTSASSQALLADGATTLPVIGVCWNALVKIHSFSCKQSFLVLDSSTLDVVLGMDWMHAHDPCISFRKRRMKLATSRGCITVSAVSSEPPPTCSSDFIEICTIDAFARGLRYDSALDADNVIVGVLQHVPPEE